jgi:pimeloyl-ACP methyl ester carboxylesterase
MESRFAETPGLRIHYLAAGEGKSGQPVVLVHGFPETAREWRHQMAALAAAGHPAYALDTRGFGLTDKPRARIARGLLRDDLVAFCDALGLRRAALVGHDWGGIIAFKAALDAPDRFSRLALLDGLCTLVTPEVKQVYWFKVAPLPEAFFADHAADFIDVRLGGADAAILGGRPGNPYDLPVGGRPRPAWIDEETLAHYRESFSRPESWTSGIEYYRHAMPLHRVLPAPEAPGGERYQPLTEADIASMWLHPDGFEAHPWSGECLDFAPEDRSKRYPGQALLVYSRRFAGLFPDHADGRPPSGTPFAEQFSRYLPNLQVRAADCGHYIPEEAPGFLNQLLVEFLS